MGAISWTDETANPVIGCSKVSAECAACYAESQGSSMARRFAKGAGLRYLNVIDGKRWNGRTYVDHAMMARTQVTRRKQARPDTGAGPIWRPARVFLGSMTDMMHETLTVEDMAAVGTWMGRQSLPHRQGPIWQIVTKRPERVPLLLPALVNSARLEIGTAPRIHLLTTVGVQSSASRLDDLLTCHGMPGVDVLGISAEPLLEALDLRPWLATGQIRWVIPGGESGPKARPCHVDWIRGLVSQCREAGPQCRVWVKQLGADPRGSNGEYIAHRDPGGSDPSEWPADLRIQEWPS
jgi:protein gp37